MYGSDYPCLDAAEMVKLVSELPLSEDEKHRLFVGNARRILGLRDPRQADAAPKKSPELV
jgi:predicted TIM-barrel fold metal-dependent hydrolase